MLSKQIVDLSEEHFAHLPSKIPEQALAKIPPELPSFLADTEASRHLRSAYIQHLVSTTLCRRVFGPFLFSLGRRHAEADRFFQSMSQELRNKSARKEAAWRQQTLYAAYTAPTAKKTTNSAAGAVVEEITHQIKPFAEPARLELIHVAVRRIVKLAAETWRYARLEREMITTQMPPVGVMDVDANEWARHDYDEFEGLQPVSDPSRTILGLLPAVSRECIHESLQAPGEEADEGCLYTRGVALYSSCPPVRTRLREREKSDHTGKSSPSRRSCTNTPSSPAGRVEGKPEAGSGSEHPRVESRHGATDESSEDDDVSEADEESTRRSRSHSPSEPPGAWESSSDDTPADVPDWRS